MPAARPPWRSLSVARAQAQSSAAQYRQIIGDEPGKLRAAAPLAKLLPKSLEAAYRDRRSAAPGHPRHRASGRRRRFHGEVGRRRAAAADFGLGRHIRATITDASPGLHLADRRHSQFGQHRRLASPCRSTQGGRTSAQVRQYKELLGQARIKVDVQRDQVRAGRQSRLGRNMSRRGKASRPTAKWLSAAQLALNGVIEERNVGQRTTLDVLNAQADVITAQINLANSERDVVVGELCHPVGDRASFGRSSRSCGRGIQAARSTTMPSRTSGSACARPTAADRRLDRPPEPFVFYD